MIQSLIRIALALTLATAGTQVQAAQEGRVIVQYKATSGLLKQAASAERSASLSARLGLKVATGRSIDDRTQVLRADGISSSDLASRLAAQPDVEYAVPDQLRHIRAMPNDPFYSSQWYLQSTEAAAIRADGAWNTTTGSSDVVIAIVDTGVRYEHPDLAGKLLPGYDFISDAPNANDGNGRDSDASDPGDYVSAADLTNPDLYALCGPLVQADSSWHGTLLAGILGAATNNSIGVAGVSWGAKLLPVRVLGKCGGFDSDIIAGMRWAAGLSVPGVPANPNPARIVNLSLGGGGFCDAAYTSVINDLTAKGVLVVAAAGNESSAVGVPANCSGVLAVGGVRNNGVKVGYSSFGPEVGISAPAGNCGYTAGICQYSINTTTNAGTQGPGASTYTTQYNEIVGTSFSAPQAAGVAALMLSVNPSLTPAELIRRIKLSARPFPVDPSLPYCPDSPTTYANVGQCNCTKTTCGAGLLSAQAAVAAAMPPQAAITALDPLSSNSLVRLDGSSSSASPGQSIVAWHWELVSAPAGASLTSFDSVTTSLQTTEAGTYVVSLTVTDSFGTTGTTQTSLDVTEATNPGGGTTGGGTTGGSTSSGGGGGAIDPTAVFGLAGLLALIYLGGRNRAKSVAAE